MKVRAHIVVSGRVQGVFFRDHTRRWAQSFGLTGWVRNMPDGRVEAVIEGEEAEVRALIARVREGPPMAFVDDVDCGWEKFQGGYDDFRITW
ncbi:MAG: acylphosphatase [Candidatus Aminicenantes bacterium]|nr:acylphosphatase [Candidatus Aminicenantes bacterium]